MCWWHQRIKRHGHSLAKESYQQLVVLSTMVFQFPGFVQLWGCAVTHFSDFVLLCFNMSDPHCSRCVKFCITSKNSPLYHTSPSWAREVILLPISPPLCCTNPLMWAMFLQQMSHFKGFLSVIIRWPLVWTTHSRGPTCLSGAISWLSH